MKALKDYRPAEFGANKDKINSLIMEQASDCAVERLKQTHDLPFEAFVEPDIEEGEEADENTPTRYKEEFQDEYNELYDEEYERIAAEMEFDLCEENGIRKRNNGEFGDRIVALQNEILEAIKAEFLANGLTQVDLSDIEEPTNVVWWGNDGYTNESPVVRVDFKDGEISLEVDYENDMITLYEYDFALNHPTWLNLILENIRETLNKSSDD